MTPTILVRALAARLDRGAHHRRAAAAMNGEQQRIEREAAFDRARHGVRDVVQLQIEEHVLLAGGGFADAVGPVRREEFEAELHAADGARRRGDQRLRARQLGRVDGAEDGVVIHVTQPLTLLSSATCAAVKSSSAWPTDLNSVI